MGDVEYALFNEPNKFASVVAFYSCLKCCCLSTRASLQPVHQTLVMSDCWAENREGKLMFSLGVSLEFSLLCKRETRAQSGLFLVFHRCWHLVLCNIYIQNVHFYISNVNVLCVELNILCLYKSMCFNSPLGLPKKFTTLGRGPTPSRGIPMPQWLKATGFTNRYRRKAFNLKILGCVWVLWD